MSTVAETGVNTIGSFAVVASSSAAASVAIVDLDRALHSAADDTFEVPFDATIVDALAVPFAAIVAALVAPFAAIVVRRIVHFVAVAICFDYCCCYWPRWLS